MSRLFMRHIEVIAEGRKIISPDFDINFNISFSDDPEPNTGEIWIFNLSDDTMRRIKKGQNLILNAGYQGDVGTILAGVIEEARGYWEGVDKVLKLVVGDATDRWYRTTVNASYKPGTKASQIIRDLVGRFGLEIGEIQLTNDITYKNGKAVSGMLQNVLRGITEETSSKFHISNGVVLIRPRSKGTRTGFLLNSDTGLIGSPQYIEGDEGKDYDVWSLLNHRIRADSLVRIQSRTANGNYRVVTGQHVCNESDFLTHMEVVGI